VLHDGLYAINPALFTVISESAVFALRAAQMRDELESLAHWLAGFRDVQGFAPIGVRRSRKQEAGVETAIDRALRPALWQQP
jgi:hypothetical protein